MMRRIFGALSLALGLATVASATTIETPTANFGGGGNTWRSCLVTNGSTKEIEVAVSFVDQAGVVEQVDDLLIPPNEVRIAFRNSASAPQAYCRVEGSFAKSKVKATFCATNPVNGACVLAVGSR